MKSTRRRSRQQDPLASSQAVRALLKIMSEHYPSEFPTVEQTQISLLNATRYALRNTAKTDRRGRPSLWKREELLDWAERISTLLDRETRGRVSLQTFICQYLPLLQYPQDIITELQNGRINRQEALTLARLSAANLQTTENEALKIRETLLRTHLASRSSQNQLRQRVKELLGESALVSRETLALGVLKTDSLLEFNANDVKHIFFETIKDLFYAIRKIQPEELSDEEIEEFILAADTLSNSIRNIEQRIHQRGTRRKTTDDFSTPATTQENVITLSQDPLTGQVTYHFH
jgi:hypothetical protein